MKRKKIQPIEGVLNRAHNLQKRYFGSPISLAIEASKGVYDDKALTISVNTAISSDTYNVYSSMTPDNMFQVWGDVVQKVRELKENMDQLAP